MARSRRPSQGRKTTKRSRPSGQATKKTSPSQRSSSPLGVKESPFERGARRSQGSDPGPTRSRTNNSSSGRARHAQGRRSPREEQVSETVVNDWAYGLHTLEEMLRSQVQAIDEIIVMEGAKGKLARMAQEAQEQGLLVKFRPRTFLQRLLGDVNFQGVGIKVRDFPYVELDDLLVAPGQRAIVFAVGLQDPGNLGALLRSSKAFGISGMIITQREGCGVTATVRKVSAGAASSMPIARVRNVTQAMRQMKEAGWWLIGLAGEGTTEIDQFDLTMPVIFLLGTEGKGLPPSVQKQCDALLRIPMVPGWDSLNVAASGAIAIYEWHRQTRKKQENPSSG